MILKLEMAMKKAFLFFFINLFFVAGSFANGGHEIRVKVNDFKQTELYMAYYLGDKQYISDTVKINDQGEFVFSGKEPLASGVYLIVLPPENRFFQILVDEKEQHFSLVTDAQNPGDQVQVENSKENKLFYEYLGFLGQMRPKAEELKKKLETAGTEEKNELSKSLGALNDQVLAYQKKLVKEHQNTLTAALIKANLPLDTPEFEGNEEEKQIKQWRHTQKHYFDNINMQDVRMLRTPFLFQRIDYFINKLQVNHPDTIAKAIDVVLEKVKPAEETFKFYLIHFLNTYARSKIVGMDAVYVHLVEKYYATGLAPWTEEEQLTKIMDNAKSLKPLLLGKVAPNILMQKKDGSKIALHDVQSDFTILYFWRYDCGHCKKSTPIMKEFYEKYKDKGIKIFAVCAKYTKEIPECWKYVEDNEIQDWLHTVDPYNRSKYSKIYDLKSTPQIYVLDEKKEILSKKIGAEQLEEVMDRLIEIKEKSKP